jgi:hypothetical protein
MPPLSSLPLRQSAAAPTSACRYAALSTFALWISEPWTSLLPLGAPSVERVTGEPSPERPDAQ